MSESDCLLLEDHGPIRVLTLNRPKAKNAFNPELARLIQAALDDAQADDDVRVVVMTGAGAAFCAGADMALFAAMAAGPAPEAAIVDRLPHAIRAFKKPIFAAVQGIAVGMAVTMLPFFDGVYASETAGFLLPFARLGLVQEFGSSFTLVRQIGRARTAEMILTGRAIDADTAERWGLVTRIFPAEELIENVLSLAADILLAPAGAIAEAKALLEIGLHGTFDEALAAEDEVLARRYGGPENAAAVAAFLARRKG